MHFIIHKFKMANFAFSNSTDLYDLNFYVFLLLNEDVEVGNLRLLSISNSMIVNALSFIK